VANYLKCY